MKITLRFLRSKKRRTKTYRMYSMTFRTISCVRNARSVDIKLKLKCLIKRLRMKLNSLQSARLPMMSLQKRSKTKKRRNTWSKRL